MGSVYLIAQKESGGPPERNCSAARRRKSPQLSIRVAQPLRGDLDFARSAGDPVTFLEHLVPGARLPVDSDQEVVRLGMPAELSLEQLLDGRAAC
jgi:hypothetical protein